MTCSSPTGRPFRQLANGPEYGAPLARRLAGGCGAPTTRTCRTPLLHFGQDAAVPCGPVGSVWRETQIEEQERSPVGRCPNCNNGVRLTSEGHPHRCRRASCRHLPIAACTFGGCERPRETATLCTGHNNQKNKGRPLAPLRPKRPDMSLRERDESGRKHCVSCQLWLDESLFSKRSASSDGLDVECRPCRALRTLTRKYSISVEQYRQMLAGQGGACAICGEIPTGGLGLVVDHQHSCCSGKSNSCGSCIRGLLCLSCNAAIGMFNEDVELLRRAAAYIAGTRSSRRLG
ncbi:endonuclease VII domain-containing protein [Micromonospora soli]